MRLKHRVGLGGSDGDGSGGGRRGGGACASLTELGLQEVTWLPHRPRAQSLRLGRFWGCTRFLVGVQGGPGWGGHLLPGPCAPLPQPSPWQLGSVEPPETALGWAGEKRGVDGVRGGPGRAAVGMCPGSGRSRKSPGAPWHSSPCGLGRGGGELEAGREPGPGR